MPGSTPRWFIALPAVLAWLLLAHPYEGLRHDGVLYLGQVLMHAGVPALSRDVFFAGGSQDRYSVYADLMAPLYGHTASALVHVGVLAASWLLMAGGVLALLRRLGLQWSQALWGLMAYAVMSPIYGGGWVFSYGEAFLTARSFAEPLLLWSLVVLLADRRLGALALQIAAALFHPLMTLPVIASTWFYLVEGDRRWLWLLTAVPAALTAAWAGLPPWDGLLKTYDPYWWSLIETGNHHLLLGNWTQEDRLTLLLDLAVLLAVVRLRPLDAGSRLVLAVVFTVVASTALTAIGADVLHAVLLTQLQLWRSHWIAHLLAMALSPCLVWRLWTLGGLWNVSACALSLALLNSHIGMDHGVATLALWASASFAAWRLRAHPSEKLVRLLCACILVCVFGLSAYQIGSALDKQSWTFPNAVWSDRFITVAAFPTVALPCFAALLFMTKTRAGRVLATSASVLLLGAAVMSWDQRTDLARAIDSPSASAKAFAAHIPPEATVYWPNQLAPVWALLERRSHYSQQQGAGVLFNRDTALIFGPRREAYRLINEDGDRCRTGALLSRDRVALAHCEMPARERLATLCGQPDAPDFLVLSDRLAPPPLATWQPPVHRDLLQTFALYRCSQLKPPGA